MFAANQANSLRLAATLKDLALGFSPVEVPTPQALIATDIAAACNCPNNCKKKYGSSCRFYSGASDKSEVIKGTCVGTWDYTLHDYVDLYCTAKN